MIATGRGQTNENAIARSCPARKWRPSRTGGISCRSTGRTRSSSICSPFRRRSLGRLRHEGLPFGVTFVWRRFPEARAPRTRAGRLQLSKRKPMMKELILPTYPTRSASSCARGVVIRTVINNMTTFDGATKEPMRQAVRDALIAFMAATAQAQAEATKEAQRAGIDHAKTFGDRRSSNISPPYACCSTGWSPARSSPRTRHTRCAVPSTWSRPARRWCSPANNRDPAVHTVRSAFGVRRSKEFCVRTVRILCQPNQATGFTAQFVRRVGDGADHIDRAVPSIVRADPLKSRTRPTVQTQNSLLLLTQKGTIPLNQPYATRVQGVACADRERVDAAAN